MKNRTIIGIVCMILAVAMTFAVAPLVNRLTSDTTTVVRLKQDVGRGIACSKDTVGTGFVQLTGGAGTAVREQLLPGIM